VDEVESKFNAIVIARDDAGSTVHDGADPHQFIEESESEKLKTKHRSCSLKDAQWSAHECGEDSKEDDYASF
jgi:hypothetical protein